MIDTDEALPILPRELTDLPDAVRRVGPPQIPDIDAPYAARLVDPDTDAEMISEWMNLPHLAQAWEYAWPPERWRLYLKAQLAGTFSRPFLTSRKGEDIGYVELYRAAKDSIATRYDAHPHDLGMHAAIADTKLVNRGIAPLMLPRLLKDMFAREPECRRVMFDPDHRNIGARRLVEYVGCSFLGEHRMANRTMALYVFPRTPEDVPAHK
ncbi:siderophore biosynthesis protein [Mycobacterium adipatum]|jgi:RimJ/RimL family protein N-acetyltransferase|uniref:Lysine N-acyltransferase MbtK n=1 Tax=Mycobacterium adipatum TaxID=1682113 RepID=A0A172UR37_9MYCO|nr:GNAT family N-acetyltransferase [Mycobacterium adipatum]ANE81525.1 siderophore biosynthesis protein [Mycobacterium adipatum]MBI5734692.1 acetyltransferase [Mycolicibacterium neoaurum]